MERLIKFKIVAITEGGNRTTDECFGVCLTNLIVPSNEVVVAFIYEERPENFVDSDYLISEKKTGFKETGLKNTSYLRLHKVSCIPASLIKEHVGHLTDNHITEVRFLLKHLLSV